MPILVSTKGGSGSKAQSGPETIRYSVRRVRSGVHNDALPEDARVASPRQRGPRLSPQVSQPSRLEL